MDTKVVYPHPSEGSSIMGLGREAEREDQAGSGLREQKSDDQEGSARCHHE